MKREVTPDGEIAQLQISNAEASDSGAYFCQASNLYGRDQQLVQLLVQGTTIDAKRDIRLMQQSFVRFTGFYSICRTTATAEFFRNRNGCQSKYKREMATQVSRHQRSD